MPPADADLDAYRRELRQEVLKQGELLDHLRTVLLSAIEAADVRGRFERWLNPLDARAVEERVNTIRDGLEMMWQAIQQALEIRDGLASVALTDGGEPPVLGT